jgi:hypothetical protein
MYIFEIIKGMLILTVISIIIFIVCELLLRTSKRYNFRRKNPHVAYTLQGNAETDFIERYTGIRNLFIVISFGAFIISGVLGIFGSFI